MSFWYSPFVNLFANLTVAQLKRAVAIKERIEELESELASVVGRNVAYSPARRNQPKRRRKMSAAARAKIAAAARARWAKYRAAKAK